MNHNPKEEPPKRSKLADIGLAFLFAVLLVGGAFLANWGMLLLFPEPGRNPLGNPLSMETAMWFFPLMFVVLFIIGVIGSFKKPKEDNNDTEQDLPLNKE